MVGAGNAARIAIYAPVKAIVHNAQATLLLVVVCASQMYNCALVIPTPFLTKIAHAKNVAAAV